MIRPIYKNQLFDYLRTNPFGVDDFTYRNGSHFEVPELGVLAYKDSGLQFYIANSPHSFNDFMYAETYYAAGFPVTQLTPRLSSHTYIPFHDVLLGLQKWLVTHVREYIEDMATPDHWQQYRNGAQLLNLDKIDFADQGQFSAEEKEQIAVSLNSIKLLIAERFATTDAQQADINAKIDYLISSVNRLNKFDWKSVLINTIITIIIALSLDTEKGRIMFEVFKTGFMVLRLTNGI
jgi:hypothetical protein